MFHHRTYDDCMALLNRNKPARDKRHPKIPSPTRIHSATVAKSNALITVDSNSSVSFQVGWPVWAWSQENVERLNQRPFIMLDIYINWTDRNSHMLIYMYREVEYLTNQEEGNISCSCRTAKKYIYSAFWWVTSSTQTRGIRISLGIWPRYFSTLVPL